MILLQASHVAKQYDGHDILMDASIVVQDGEKVALIGPNGAGKSTFLRILIGEERRDQGDVSLARGASLGYVSQFTTADEDTTVFDFVAESFEEIYRLEARIRETEHQMADPTVYSDARRFQEVTSLYDRLRHEFEEAGGYGVEARIRRVLDGLNFPKEVHGRPISALSGGQRTRLALAKLLSWQPDVLVLDEPTNYLDTDTLTWLEDYLSGYAGAVLVVSHDRYFLDKVVRVVYELDGGRTTRYVGNYSDYMEEKALSLEALTKRYEAQQEEIARMETFIQKNIVRASTTKRAQSRRKLLEKMERLDKPSGNVAKMALAFQCRRESGKDVLTLQDLVTGFPNGVHTGPFRLLLSRGQRVAIVGPNGIGKTTMLRTLLGQQSALSGTLKWGANVDIGYYEQEQTFLSPDKTVLSQIWDEHPELDVTTVRTALGRFLFRGEEVDKPVAGLSGGERSRLALCRLMLLQANVLVMDEPTNHLDLLAKEVLEDALADYDGTLLMVSHDRYFIDALATHILAIDQQGYKLYIGNYTEYVEKKQADLKWAEEQSAEDTANPGRKSGDRRTQAAQNPIGQPMAGHSDSADPSTSVATTPSLKPAQRPHVRSADVRKLRDRVEQVEQRIEQNEARQAEIGELFTDPNVLQNAELTISLQEELKELTLQHEDLMSEWAEAAQQLDSLLSP